MVLDNADDGGLFFSGNTSNERWPLVSFLPQATPGSILVTLAMDGRERREDFVAFEPHNWEVGFIAPYLGLDLFANLGQIERAMR
jgi:hypothetical protein